MPCSGQDPEGCRSPTTPACRWRHRQVAIETAIAFWTNNQRPWKASYSMLTAVTQVGASPSTANLLYRPRLHSRVLQGTHGCSRVLTDSTPGYYRYSGGALGCPGPVAMPIAVAQVIMPHDSSTNNDRLALYTQWLAALGLRSAAVAPPVSTANSLRCGAGWADANAKCGTPCPRGPPP